LLGDGEVVGLELCATWIRPSLVREREGERLSAEFGDDGKLFLICVSTRTRTHLREHENQNSFVSASVNLSTVNISYTTPNHPA
jgi:hypothetical protein